MNEIKKCPFCGGEVKLMAIAGEPFPPTYEVELDKITSDSDDICYIHCPTCGVNWHKEVRIESFPLDTIKAWNTRKPLERVIDRLEEQEEECKKYWDEFDDEDAFGGMNAYMNSIAIIKQEMM